MTAMRLRAPLGTKGPGATPLAAGVAALVLAAGAAGCGGSSDTKTQSSSSSPSHSETIGAIAAGYLGISRAQLRHELAKGRSLAQIAESKGRTPKSLAEAILKVHLKRLEAEVKSGAISQAQLETRMASQRRHVEIRLERAGSVAVSVVTSAAEHYLHMSEARLRAERAKGLSLAQIAASVPGRSAAGLIDAVVAAEQARLRAAGNDTGAGAPSPAQIKRRATLVVDHKPVSSTGKGGGKKHSSAKSSESESSGSQASSEGG
ncbi:MAG TPA: hypothetical protein VMA83_11395 [Solirubrobacteraceae bacterium]|nr:hypothetical protein [Solirubrobacteraceae bacterium]